MSPFRCAAGWSLNGRPLGWLDEFFAATVSLDETKLLKATELQALLPDGPVHLPSRAKAEAPVATVVATADVDELGTTAITANATDLAGVLLPSSDDKSLRGLVLRIRCTKRVWRSRAERRILSACPPSDSPSTRQPALFAAA